MQVRAGGRRGLDLGKQKHWIVVSSVCSSLELAEAAWPVTDAGQEQSMQQCGIVGAGSKDSSVG